MLGKYRSVRSDCHKTVNRPHCLHSLPLGRLLWPPVSFHTVHSQPGLRSVVPPQNSPSAANFSIMFTNYLNIFSKNSKAWLLDAGGWTLVRCMWAFCNLIRIQTKRFSDFSFAWILNCSSVAPHQQSWAKVYANYLCTVHTICVLLSIIKPSLPPHLCY